MKFTPVSKEELATANLIPVGDYDAMIDDAEEKISSNGNDMLVLDLLVKMPDGKQRKLRDWVVLPMFMWKFQHLCEAAGLEDKYNAGNVDQSDFCGRNLRVRVYHEEFNDEMKAKVKDYFPPDGAAQQHAAQTVMESTPSQEDIPF